MKALISGSSGFIGSHLVKALSPMMEVVPITRELLYNPSDLEDFLEEQQPDYIYHLGAYGNHANQTDIAMIVLSNIIGTFNLLQASKDVDYKGFINFGSSSEYGKKLQPMKETDLPETDSFYGASKVAATYLSKAFAQQYNKPIITMRPFSVYGEGEADFRFIPTIIRSALRKEEMLLDPFPTHDWIYIKDFIDALLLLVTNIDKLRDSINIGSGEATSNQVIVAALTQISGIPLKTKRSLQMRPNDSDLWVADITLLTLLNWKPKFTLLEGLVNTYKYYKAKYGQ